MQIKNNFITSDENKLGKLLYLLLFTHVAHVTVEYRYNHPLYNEARQYKETLYNEVPGITNDIFQPGQSYSKIYGAEP